MTELELHDRLASAAEGKLSFAERAILAADDIYAKLDALGVILDADATEEARGAAGDVFYDNAVRDDIAAAAREIRGHALGPLDEFNAKVRRGEAHVNPSGDYRSRPSPDNSPRRVRRLIGDKLAPTATIIDKYGREVGQDEGPDA